MSRPATYRKGARDLSRREFLRLAGFAAVGLASGCAVNPVTGRSQLMLLSEENEIRVDRERRGHQFSADYGPVQDARLNEYLDRTGIGIASFSHRPRMPYSFRAVNAPYVNAYAFPGGSVACTRGILLELENEAQLAALLGHELGHVNARHTAQQMSRGVLVSAALGGLSAWAGSGDSALGSVVSGLGGLGAGALLAKYSRDNEREADSLALEYAVRAGYGPEGMVGLMDMLRRTSSRKPGALEIMFSTHPMSEERYRTMRMEVERDYAEALGRPLERERYMDLTEGLRAVRGAVEAMQEGDKAMAQEDYGKADGHYRRALREAPGDYAALVKSAECSLARKRYGEAGEYAEAARSVYPEEPRSYYVSGVSRILVRDWDGALEDFSAYENRLPGNPNTAFLKGFSLEGMGRKREAAREYHRYLQSVSGGDQAEYARGRLVAWGYVSP
jgi:beta-barrel assembly-enhancing protease